MPQSLEENLGAGDREGHLTEGQLDQGWGTAGRKDGGWLPTHFLLPGALGAGWSQTGRPEPWQPVRSSR